MELELKKSVSSIVGYKGTAKGKMDYGIDEQPSTPVKSNRLPSFLRYLPIAVKSFSQNRYLYQLKLRHMKKSSLLLILGSIFGVLLFVALIIFLYYKNMYNTEVKLNQQVKSQWANVESSYQRRADLIPNLVNTVKGYAEHERETFREVIEARSKATSTTINADNLDAESMAKFQEAQAGLSSALSRLLVVAEQYPDLKANQNFLELQAQLEGTENRINVERTRFNETVQQYNQFALRLMVRLILHPEEKPYFKAKEGTDEAPKVEF